MSGILFGKLTRATQVLCLATLMLEGCRSANYGSFDSGYTAAPEVEVTLPDYQPAAPRTFDLLHTHLDLKVDWENRALDGQATLTLRPYFYAQDQLVLDAKSFEVVGCDLVVGGEHQALAYEYDGKQLFIDLEKEYSRKDTLTIKIKYVAKPYERTAGAGRAITSDRGLFFINPTAADTLKPRQLWTQGETSFNSCWFPTIDAPNERFTQEILITVDSALTTLSNGMLQSTVYLGNGLKKDHWKLDQPHAPYLAMMAVGDFMSVADKAGNTPLGYYVEPAYARYARNIFGNTPEMIAFFENILQYPFPWPKYDQVVVRDYVSGAMENTTASVFMEDLQVDNRELLDDHWDGIIAHELFHQWFGDLVTCESWANLALNEGFANYAEYLWNEHKYGIDEAEYHLWIEMDNYLAEVATGKVDPIINYFYDNPDDLFDSHRYSKAGLVLHMLRKYTGDEAFFEALHNYLERNAWQSVEIDDLRMAFEATTGEDLQWFFEQWFELPGHPVLEVRDWTAGDSLHISIRQLQVSDTIGMFAFPLTIDLWLAGEKVTHEVLVDAPEMELSLPVSGIPDLIIIDPDRVLLAEIDYPKTKEELLLMLDNGSGLRLRREALETLFTEADSVAVGAAALRGLRDKSPRIRELTLDNLAGRGHLKVDGIKTEVKRLLADSSALVRAAACYAYSESGANDVEEVLMQALNDSSYSVIGAALEALLPDYVESPPWLGDFLTVRHLNVAAPIAGFFNQTMARQHLSWYHQNLLHFHGMDRWVFLQYYIEYIVLTESYKDPGVIEVLKYLATQDSQYFNRVAAFQSLTLVMPESPENRNVLMKMAEQEEDPRVRTVMTDLLEAGGE